jgi:hypothetical protein
MQWLPQNNNCKCFSIILEQWEILRCYSLMGGTTPFTVSLPNWNWHIAYRAKLWSSVFKLTPLICRCTTGLNLDLHIKYKYSFPGTLFCCIQKLSVRPEMPLIEQIIIVAGHIVHNSTVQWAENKRMFRFFVTWFVFNLQRREYIFRPTATV